MTRFIWTHEKGTDLALRDAKHHPRLLVGKQDEGAGFICTVFEPGFPGGGPCKSRIEACRIGEQWIRDNVDPKATFAGLPEYVFKSGEAVKRRRAVAKARAA
jgi:hypothetical protein